MLTEIKLKTAGEGFKNIARLSRPYFLEKYLKYDEFSDGNSDMIFLRRKILNKVIKEEQVIEAGESVLTLDTAGYHPEDKNFKYYQKYSGKELMGFLGSPNLKHSGAVTCVDVSPDGIYIISGSIDNTLKLWDLETGQCIKTIPLPWIPMEIKPAPHKPGLFATANANGTVTLFDFSEIFGKHWTLVRSAHSRLK